MARFKPIKDHTSKGEKVLLCEVCRTAHNAKNYRIAYFNPDDPESMTHCSDCGTKFQIGYANSAGEIVE